MTAITQNQNNHPISSNTTNSPSSDENIFTRAFKLALKVGTVSAICFAGYGLGGFVGLVAAGALAGFLYDRTWRGAVHGAVGTGTAFLVTGALTLVSGVAYIALFGIPPGVFT